MDEQEGKYKRPVAQYSPYSGELIQIWPSAYEAAKATGSSKKANVGGIINCCTGKQKTAHGFIWRYEDENVRTRRYCMQLNPDCRDGDQCCFSCGWSEKEYTRRKQLPLQVDPVTGLWRKVIPGRRKADDAARGR